MLLTDLGTLTADAAVQIDSENVGPWRKDPIVEVVDPTAPREVEFDAASNPSRY